MAFPALLLGAVGIAYAPIAVRLSEVGPSATAFYRLFLALPFLWFWARTERAADSSAAPVRSRAALLGFALAGGMFAADLALWHASIQFTTVANATLLANFAPFVVTIGAWFLFQERITGSFLVAMVMAITGAGLLVGVSVHLSGRHLFGDALGILTAVFYGGYMLSVKWLRQSHSTARIMFWSGVFCSPALFLTAVASGEVLLPAHWRGWGVLLSLALVSQIAGQSLIVYAFAHLRASFSALSLLLQPVLATLLAWVILAEPISPQQIVGGVVILAAIVLARNGKK